MEKKLKTKVTLIECPKCHTEQEFTMHYYIDANEDSELKDKILNNTLFFFQCEKCGKKIPVYYNSLYHDHEKKLLVYMVPNYESAGNAEFRKTISEMGQLMPIDKREGYVNRIAPNANVLKEKIMIHDEGLDDRIIELMKVYYISQMANSFEDEELIEVLFDSSNDINGFVFMLRDKNPLFGEINMEAYKILAEDFADASSESTPEGFASIDLEWAQKLASNE